MPIALDPAETFTVTLPEDESKPDAALFRFRFLTGRQWRTLAHLLDREDGRKAYEQLDDLIAQLDAALVGWDGLAESYASGQIDAVLTPHELVQLGVAVCNRASLGRDDAGKSNSQQPSDTAKSAADAAADAAPSSKTA